jgi:hypothetical protein
MPSSGMLNRVALVRTDGFEESIAFFVRVTRIGELGTTLTVTSIIMIGEGAVRQTLLSISLSCPLILTPSLLLIQPSPLLTLCDKPDHVEQSHPSAPCCEAHV